MDPRIKEVFSNASARRRNIDIENIKSSQLKAITAKGQFVTKILWLAAIIMITFLAYASSNVSGGDLNKFSASDISVLEDQAPDRPLESKNTRPPDFIFLMVAFLIEGLILFYMIKFVDVIVTSILSRISHDRFKTIHFIC